MWSCQFKYKAKQRCGKTIFILVEQAILWLNVEWPNLLVSSCHKAFFIWKATTDVTMQYLSLIHCISLPCTPTLCSNIHASHIANVCMLSISLSVVLSVFHDLFSHFSPPRTSIFNRGGSMFSHGLIKDMVCMCNMHVHNMWMHMRVCCLQWFCLYSLLSLPVVRNNLCHWSQTCS